jgi:folate-binding protein YgfZ
MISHNRRLLISMPLETPLLDLHRSAGAETGEYFGTQLPARFGDFTAEYLAARDSVALADTNFRACFAFYGPDAQRYLNAILTSNVRDLKPGQGAVGLLLTPQGHILAEVETLALPDRILAISHALVRERTFSTFDKFIIMDDVTIDDVTSSTGTLDLLGPLAAIVILEAVGVDITAFPALAHVDAKFGSLPCRIVRHTWVDHPAAMLVVAREHLAPMWQQLAARVQAHGGAPAGMEALNSIRLESGIPWFGQDYDDKNIPHEAGLEHSHISYEKGCYTGQEIVERVRSRGHVNRRLAEMKFLASTPPAPGTKLFTMENVAASEVGNVTSAGFSPLLEQPIGIGYLRREHSAIGTRLDASGIPAEVISPPLAEKKIPA